MDRLVDHRRHDQPSRRSAAMKVVVSPRPCGTTITSRLPQAERHRKSPSTE
jgi:hypothetical protein